MHKIFTHLLIKILVKATFWRKHLSAVTLLVTVLATSFYLMAAVIEPKTAISISSDKALNGPAFAFTPVGNIIFKETSSTDFNANSTLTLTAPTGWAFKASGVAAAVTHTGSGNPTSNVTLGTIGYGNRNAQNNTTTIINIPFTVSKQNVIDIITISNVEIVALNGANLENNGSILLDVADRKTITEAIFPLTVVNLSQTIGSPNKLAFVSQPTDAVTGQSIGNFSVEIRDFFNRKLTNATNPITIAIGNNPAGGTLSGTLTANAIKGVASFSGNSIDNAGSGYTLRVSAGNLTFAISNSFNISVPKPLIISINSCLSVGDPAQDVTINGNNFAPGAQVLVNGAERSTTVTNADLLQFSLTAGDLASVRNLSIVVRNPNGDLSDTESLPVYALPSINAPIYTITGNKAICGNTKGAVYGAPGEYGATSYDWKIISGDATITSGNGTRYVSLDFGDAGGTVVLKVVPYNPCGRTGADHPQYSTIEINIIANPTIVTNDPAAVCGPATVDLTVPAITAGSDADLTFSYYRDAAATVAVADPTKVGNGVYYIKGTDNSPDGTGCSAIEPVTVTVISPPLVNINAPQAVCAPNTVNLQDPAITNGSDPGLTFGYFTNPEATIAIADPTKVGNGTYYIKGTDAGTNGTGCSAISAVNVIVNELPTAPTATLNDPKAERCGPGSVTLTVSGAPAGGSYQWYGVSNNIQTVIPNETGASFTTPNLSETTVYYVAAKSLAGCESPTRTAVTATIKPVPSAPTVTGTFQRCGPGTLTLTAEGAPADGSYRWYTTAAGGTAIAGETASTFTTPSLNTSTTYYVAAVSSGGCESARVAVPATINTIPNVAAIAGNNSVCTGSSISLSNPTKNGVWSSDNTNIATVNASTGVVTGLMVGKAQISYTITGAGKCATTVTKEINVVATPAVSFEGLTQNQVVYSGDPAITLTNGSPAGGTFSGTGVTTTNGVSIFTPCDAGVAGSKTITYSYDNGSCITTASVTITLIKSTYQVLIDANPFPICRGQNTNYSATIYRDAVVTYPYQVDANGQPIIDPATVTNANPNGFPLVNNAYPFPATDPAYKKQYAYRYYKPRIESYRGYPIHEKAGQQNAVMFTYVWGKNDDNSTGNNSSERGIAQLSSTDYLSVIVRLNNGQKLACNQTTFSDESNRMYLGTPEGYAINIAVSPNPVCSNATEPVVFTATPNAAAPFDWSTIGLVVQWFKNDVPFKTGTTFSLLPSEIANGDKFRIEFTSTLAGCSTSQSNSVITMTVNQPPAITSQPVTNLSLCPGSTASFSVSATGTGLTYQWYKRSGSATDNGVAVVDNGRKTGANTSNLIINTITADDAGFYYVVIGGTCSPPTATSNNAQLVINPLPVAQTVTAPSYCAAISNGSTISLADLQTGVTYRLKDKIGNVLTTLAAGTLAFDGIYPVGNYTVEGSTSSGCTVEVGSVAITNTPAITNIILPQNVRVSDELLIGEEGTYEVILPEGSPAWTYDWYISYIYRDGSEKTEKQTVHGPVLTITSISEFMTGVSVNQIAPTSPTNICPDVETFRYDFARPVLLPVEMIYLKATKQESNVVKVEWATAQEKDNKGFEVQVSQDAKTYRTLSFVPTQNGNTLLQQVYTFYDKENGKHGTRYYRLKQVDNNGDSEYFGPKAVTMDEAGSAITAYPNPFVNEINLQFTAEESGDMLVEITTVAGAKVYAQKVKVQKGFNTETLKLNSNLANGVYIITTHQGDKTDYIRLMKQQ